MVSKNTFSASCIVHLDALENAFSNKKDKAKTTSREKQLFQLFDKKLKEVSSTRSAKANFDELPEQLSNLQERIIGIRNIDPTVKNIKEFAEKALAKLQQVCTALESPVDTGIKQPRPVFNLDGTPTPTLKKKSSQKATARPPSLSEALRTLTAKDLLISQDDELPFDKQAAKAQGIFGIANKGGNDCYQNALCQALLTKLLKKDVIDRLPKELRRHFYQPDGIDSQNLRNDILRFSNFLAISTNHGKNIKGFLRTQEDAHELLEALLNETDKDDYSTKEPAHSLKLLAKDPDTIDAWQTSIEKTTSKLGKLFLYSLFIPAKMMYYLCSKIAALFTEEDEVQILNVAPTPINLPPKTPREEINHTKFSFTKDNRWNVEDLPDHLKHHENFGAQTNHSQRKEPAHGIIQIPLDKKLGNFNLQEKFNHLFEPEHAESEVSELVALEDATIGPRNQKTHTAPLTIKKTISSIPGSLALHIVRFGSDRVKRFDAADNFNPILTINQDLFTEEARPDQPINMHLQSFIVHKGEFGAGHYVAFRKVNNEWYYFDDSKCTKIKEEAALRAAKHAYLYFFEREDLL